MADDDTTEAVLGRLEKKIDSLEARLNQPPMTPGRAAAEARRAMQRGYDAEAEARAATKAARGSQPSADPTPSEDPKGGDDE